MASRFFGVRAMLKRSFPPNLSEVGLCDHQIKGTDVIACNRRA